mmetsp:Transcript_10005/g.18802  ORF Transcript_10005/g.18802 Transcript_10005/m.18802 type:complete len:396 (+) Transcript_10005:702-1889(+)
MTLGLTSMAAPTRNNGLLLVPASSCKQAAFPTGRIYSAATCSTRDMRHKHIHATMGTPTRGKAMVPHSKVWQAQPWHRELLQHSTQHAFSSRKGKFQAASAKALLQLSASFQDDHPPVKDAARSNTSARSVNPAAPDRSTGVVSLPDEHQGPLQGLSKSRSPRVLRPRALQSERVERVSNGSPGQPLAIFTAGIPGAGKTHTLNQFYGLEECNILDLDKEIKHHPLYNPLDPAEVYNNVEAYAWANERLEASLKAKMSAPPAVWAIDGTGTKVERTMRRMKEAQNAGCHVILLYVKVSFETAVERNKHRERTAPNHVLKEYLEKIDGAVEELSHAVDEFVVYDNNEDNEIRVTDFRSHLLQWWKYKVFGSKDSFDEDTEGSVLAQTPIVCKRETP